MVPLVVFLVVLLATAVWSRRLVDGPITPPTILTVAGLAVAVGSGAELPVDTAGVRLATEVTLSLVLFADATRIPLPALRSAAGLPGRLLGIGLPLSIALMTGLTMLVTGMGFAPSLLVGAALSATDAALASIIVESRDLPARIRETINVESGLNDGLATPVVTIAIALVLEQSHGTSAFMESVVWPLLTAVVIGVVVGWVGGRVLRWAGDHDLLDGVFAQVGTIGLVGLVMAISQATGAIMFVAAFLAGSAFRQAHGDDTAHLVEFTEDAARLLTMAAFFAFGMVQLPQGLADMSVPSVVVAAVALTIGRMLPTTIALVDSGLRPPTVALIGWFGPRGLATVLFALLAAEELGDALPPQAVSVMAVTVMGSLVLHGATARPLTSRYVAWLRHQHPTPGSKAPDVPIAGMTGDDVEVTRTRT